MTDPVETLLGAYRREILALLLLRPDESFYVRELARMTGIPVGSVNRELKLLTEAELLIRRPAGNQVRYQANRASPIFEELASIFRKTVGLAGVLHRALKPLGKKVTLAFVFGSLARGKARQGSDVDLLVIGAADFTRVVKCLMGMHERLGREINPVVMTAAAFRKKYHAKDRFVIRIMKEPKIFVTGTSDDLEKLVEDRATG
ncbi:MAG: nucleotidyltransferase domain-containing protein [Gammaproteobacteria bacterium]|nr:nucleotidyltransferase domain-containing protein [Gammaproteobacteria bacterium]